MRSMGRFRPGAGLVLSYYEMLFPPNEQLTLCKMGCCVSVTRHFVHLQIILT